MDNDLQIGEKIRKQRIKANLTQEKLAEYSDLSINFISKLERGQKKNISILKLNAICRALEISISELLQEESNISLAHLTPSSLQLIHELQTLDRADCIVKRACLLYQLARYLIKISQLGSLGKIASALIAR